jgi:hypothetical protein
MDEDCSTRGELIDVCNVLFGVPKGKDQLLDVSADGRKVLNLALKKWTIL